MITLMILMCLSGFSETYALIMGAGDYLYDTILKLPAAKKDAIRMKETLIELGIAQEGNITYIENPVLTDIKIGLIEFLKKGEKDDRLIVYFSGHSKVEINENGKKDTYLCGVDVRKNYIRETAYNFRENFEKLGEAIKAKETLMIFDTCYAGGMTKERDLTLLRIENKSFEAISQNKGINFLFSSGPDETSQEIGEDKGGWYTYHLIEGMKGEANLNGDDYITLNELSTYVRQKVQQTTKDQQNPMSMIVQEDIRILRDQRKKYDDTLKKITDAHFEGELEYERFQRFGKILKQKESEDTDEEAKIRQVLLNYNTLPALGIEYVLTMTEPYFEAKPITKQIRIETTPSNATIYINGSYKGTSPLTIGLEEGTHTIEARKDGYVSKRENKTIGSQTKDLSRIETITLTLEKETGSLYINSNPSGAYIYLNGTYKGTTSKKIENLDPGYYTLKLTKSGYEDKSESIRIEPGKRTTQYLTLEKEETTGSLYINSNPSGAYIYINGNYKGTTTKTIEELEPGDYSLKLTKNGYNDKTENITIEAGKRETAYITLQEKETETYTPGRNVPDQVLVKAGTFQMGDEHGDLWSACRPVHTVKLTYEYYIGKTEVTFNQYDAYCEATGKSKPDDEGWGRGNRPVINVSWNEAIKYCNWLSEKEGLSKAYDSEGNLLDKNGRQTTDITQVEGYRLLTEAEWEYAARGGHKSTSDYKYAGGNNLYELGWYRNNSTGKTQEVGQKSPNELGIYDMSGNVWDWCYDWYDSEYYDKSPRENPTGPNSASGRVARGGSWRGYAEVCR